jgi:KaiC/GvpD/RAD55 family RecA-like ATPase/CheY-like chemotaxis protein
LSLTGLDALDAIAGGLADGRSFLLQGPLGSGKTSFALQFLYRGLVAGEPAAIVTRRSPQALFEHGRALGFDVESFAREGQLVIVEYLPKVVENSIRLRDEERIFEELQAVLGDDEPRRLVFDPVTPLLTTGSASASLFRARAFMQAVDTLGATTLLMFDTPEAEEYVGSCKDFAHGVLKFSVCEGGGGRLVIERLQGMKGRTAVVDFDVSLGAGVVSRPATPGNGGVAATATVLLAEPDPAQREMVKKLIGQACAVVDAEDGADVLAKVATSRPQLVIMHANAEDGIDGAMVCQRLRQNGVGLPVLLLSRPIRRTRDRVALMSSGADDVLEHPFDGRILKLKVQALLRRTLGSVTASAPAQRRDGTVFTDKPSYFQERLLAEASFSKDNGLRFGVAVLRLPPGTSSTIPMQELKDLAKSLIREYDLVLLGQLCVAVLLAETEEAGIRAFLRRFAEGWNRTPAPVVNFQSVDGQAGTLAAAQQLIQGVWSEDTAVG